MEWLIGLLAIIISAFAWLLHGATSNRLNRAKEEAEHLSGVIDVRRKAEDAKHNDPDAIKRVRGTYNS